MKNLISRLDIRKDDFRVRHGIATFFLVVVEAIIAVPWRRGWRWRDARGPARIRAKWASGCELWHEKQAEEIGEAERHNCMRGMGCCFSGAADSGSWLREAAASLIAEARSLNTDERMFVGLLLVLGLGVRCRVSERGMQRQGWYLGGGDLDHRIVMWSDSLVLGSVRISRAGLKFALTTLSARVDESSVCGNLLPQNPAILPTGHPIIVCLGTAMAAAPCLLMRQITVTSRSVFHAAGLQWNMCQSRCWVVCREAAWVKLMNGNVMPAKRRRRVGQ